MQCKNEIDININIREEKQYVKSSINLRRTRTCLGLLLICINKSKHNFVSHYFFLIEW